VTALPGSTPITRIHDLPPDRAGFAAPN
jgi:hypothetical protein